MTMSTRNSNIALSRAAGFGLALLSLIGVAFSDAACRGPLQYYNELGCLPIYKSSEGACPISYNCDHLKSLPTNKCVVNGHEYNIGEELRAEDRNPCDICTCTDGPDGARFSCAIVDCFARADPGCYLKHNATSCCPGEQVCPEKEEDRPTCTVDGKVYKDGDYFKPAAEPDKVCYCGAGYTGENVEPFCYTPKSACGTMLRHTSEVRSKCIPTYYYDQPLNSSCNLAYRCQNQRDVVIAKNADSSSESKSASDETVDAGMLCHFGNLTMRVGDELNQATHYDSVCMKCVCEVPPVPSCQRLADSECDIRNHPDFSAQ